MSLPIHASKYTGQLLYNLAGASVTAIAPKANYELNSTGLNSTQIHSAQLNSAQLISTHPRLTEMLLGDLFDSKPAPCTLVHCKPHL